MKLLTLEEIEKIEKFRADMIELEPEPCELGVWQVEMSRFNQYQLPNLLAIARAYWEMMAILNDSPTLHKDRETEDKPHAPTIKAFIDGLKWANDPKKRFTVNELVNYLESILKDLNN